MFIDKDDPHFMDIQEIKDIFGRNVKFSAFTGSFHSPPWLRKRIFR
jgi:hypothetical protein